MQNFDIWYPCKDIGYSMKIFLEYLEPLGSIYKMRCKDVTLMNGLFVFCIASFEGILILGEVCSIIAAVVIVFTFVAAVLKSRWL